MKPQPKKPRPRCAAAQQQMQVEVDDTHVTASYANFCRVTGSPEELIIDFGLESAAGRHAEEPDRGHAARAS